MNGISLKASEYVAVWRNILGGWLHWQDARIQRFIDRYEEDLGAAESSIDSVMFFRESPIKYVSPLLLPPSLRNHPSTQEIERKIERAVNLEYPYNSDTHDWDAARRRVEAVLTEYAASLPTANQPAWYEEEDPKIQRFIAQSAQQFTTARPTEPLNLPRSAKPAQLAWTLLQQGKLGVKGYTIEQALALPWPLHVAVADRNPGAAECLAIVMQTPGPRKVTVFHYAGGWCYWIYDVD
jgi:hypothetical protein